MSSRPPLPFVLVHGGWSDSSAWRRLVPVLEARGHAVRAPDLPGCEPESAAVAEVGLGEWVATVVQAVEAFDSPVVLVGHSLGGISVSEAAERIPKRVAASVYVAAFLLRNGESRHDLAELEADPLIPSPYPERGAIPLSADALLRLLDVPHDRGLIERYAALQPVLPVAPLRAALRLSDERYGRVPRYFVKSLRDAALAPSLQEWMLARTAVRRIYELPSNHVPALTHTHELADILSEIEAEVR